MNIDDLYQLSTQLLDYMERNGSEALSDEQHTLLAYCYLDSQVQEGGFVQLIASGYGDYIFANPVADSLRRWRVKQTPKILDKAKVLYQKYGKTIEEHADEDLNILRGRFADFEELDGDYYEIADNDIALVCEYVQAHLVQFQVNISSYLAQSSQKNLN